MIDYKRGPEFAKCAVCKSLARRVGAQDDCDVYVCDDGHITRIKVGTQNDSKRVVPERGDMAC